jgi:hypothetical protein
MPTFDDVRRIGAAFPGVVEAPSYHGSPALKVGKRPFCRLWSDREHERDGVSGSQVLVVFCDLEEKDALIGASGGVLFSTAHYAGHPAMLVRLADVSLELLAEILEDSYRSRAPAHLVAELEQAR